MIQLDWPWVFVLIPLPLVMTLLRRRGSARAIQLPPMLSDALLDTQSSSQTSINLRTALLWLSWLSLLFALSQPWHPGDIAVQPVTGRAIAIAVDVSGSMDRSDFQLNGKTSDRLSVVKAVAGSFIDKRQGDRISLILYGKEAFIASPLTFDLGSIKNILASAGIGMAGRSTAIGDAIGLSIQTLTNDPSNLKAIVLLSDGTNNAGSVEPESAAKFAATLGIRVHTIAMGSEDQKISGYSLSQSADLDEDTLKSIAKESGGTFFRAKKLEDLQAVYSAIDELERTEVNAPPTILRHDLRHWSLYILLASLLCHALLGSTRP